MTPLMMATLLCMGSPRIGGAYSTPGLIGECRAEIVKLAEKRTVELAHNVAKQSFEECKKDKKFDCQALWARNYFMPIIRPELAPELLQSSFFQSKWAKKE